ncbi:MAG TPA: hypothetical protein VFV41_26415 [Streptosporangiaceae bacterium]|nr:hypothetical protein [Streptosporangiaceae bacterium]
MTILIGLLSAAFGATLGAITTFLTTRSAMRLGLEHEYDKTLRDIRLKGYQRLFHLTAQIPRHWLLTPEPSRAELREIRTSFHDWYYHADAHGMFLASDSKSAYITLMNTLDAALFEISPSGDTKLCDRPDSKLSPEESHRLLELASDLRHQLAADIGAANPPRTRSHSPAPTVPSLGPVPHDTW